MGSKLEGLGNDLGHLFEDQRGGEVAGLSPAHAVRDGKDQVVLGQGMLTGILQLLCTLRAGRKGEPGVVVALLA